MTAEWQRGEDHTAAVDTVEVRMKVGGTVLVAVQMAVGRKQDEDRMVVVADRAAAQTVVDRKEDGDTVVGAADRVVGSGHSSFVMHSSRC